MNTKELEAEVERLQGELTYANHQADAFRRLRDEARARVAELEAYIGSQPYWSDVDDEKDSTHRAEGERDAAKARVAELEVKVRKAERGALQAVRGHTNALAKVDHLRNRNEALERRVAELEAGAATTEPIIEIKDEAGRVLPGLRAMVERARRGAQ